ncbi:hypothetical protein VPH35_018783 [Triticum aestivum]
MYTYGLDKNSFMKQVYDVRYKWAKPYLKDSFCAKMCSTQRSECMNNVLKSYVARSAPLNSFVVQFNKLYADRCSEEDYEHAHISKVCFKEKQIAFLLGHICISLYFFRFPRMLYLAMCQLMPTSEPFFFTLLQDEIVLKFNLPIERHASRVCTRAMFRIFSEELFHSGPYEVKGNQLDGKMIVEHVNAETRKRWCKVNYEVDVDRESDTYICECGMFEHSGILCRHILKVMLHVKLHTIPNQYILKRWTRNARDNLPKHLKCYQEDASVQVSQTFRHNLIYVKALELAKLANTAVPTFQHAINKFHEMQGELLKMIAIGGYENPTTKIRSSSGTMGDGGS